MIHIQTTRDAALLASLNEPVQSWHAGHHPERFKPFSLPETTNFFNDLLEHENALCYVALEDNQPAGFMVAMIETQPENAFCRSYTVLKIDQIGVLPAFKRTGIGSALILEAVKYARQNSIATILLDHWADNEQAASFFKQAGFREMRSQLCMNIGLSKKSGTLK